MGAVKAILMIGNAFWSSLLVLCLNSFLQAAEPFDVLKKTTWVSDKSATLVWVKNHRPNLEKRKNFADIFGKMTIIFANDAVETSINGTIDKKPHKFIGQTTREIAFITKDFLLERDVIVVIEIDEDENGYWIYNSQFDVKEHFVPKR